MSGIWMKPPIGGTVSQEAAQLQAKIRAEKLRELEADPYIGYSSINEADNDSKCTSQVEVLSRLLNRENVFISGPAGSGKTTIINRFIDLIDSEFEGTVTIAKTATTGIAAQLIKGRTIHSWAGLGISSEPFDPKKVSPFMWAAKERIVGTDVLVIDEISMMPAHLFTKLDKVLKFFRRNQKPFGGIQLVLMGDFLQLPPIPDRDSDADSSFAITTEEWKNADVSYCYMDKVHRASDPDLKHLLWRISLGKGLDKKAQETIEKRKSSSGASKIDGKVYTTLFTTNRSIEKFNKEKLAENRNPLKVFKSETRSGDFKNVEKLYKEQGIPKELEFKVGATVIVTSNRADPMNPKVSNGSIGVITQIYDQSKFSGGGSITVRLNDGSMSTIYPLEYSLTEKKDYVDPIDKKKKTMETTIASVTQMPLKLGYAISVHKSQGQTFDGIVADLSKIFTPGLGYVALSRVRSSDDLVIEKIDERAFEMDPKSLKVSKFVKKKAFFNNKKFKENIEDYDSLLTNPLARMTKWID